jgi:hypothetical protein
VSAAALRDAGNQLGELARKLGVSFEFYAIAKLTGDVVNAAANVPSKRSGEAVAVHWLRHALYNATGDDGAAMRLVRWLEPTVLTLVEQERGGAGRFLDRFVSALHHYSALFDSMGASRPVDDDTNRHLVEDGVLGREITNVLAVGGLSRSGREKFGCCKTELNRHGILRAGGGGTRADGGRGVPGRAGIHGGGRPRRHGSARVEGDSDLRGLHVDVVPGVTSITLTTSADRFFLLVYIHSCCERLLSMLHIVFAKHPRFARPGLLQIGPQRQ